MDPQPDHTFQSGLLRSEYRIPRQLGLVHRCLSGDVPRQYGILDTTYCTLVYQIIEKTVQR